MCRDLSFGCYREMDLGKLDDLVGYHLRRASSAFAVDFSRALDGTGMRQVLFAVLSVVIANPGVKQGEVGRAPRYSTSQYGCARQ